MKKKIALFMFVAASVFSAMSINVLADDINVYLDETQINFSGTQPQITDGRTLVPLRGVFDAMGYEVEWDAEEKTAYLTKGSTIVSTSQEEMTLTTRDGVTDIECDVLPRIVNGYFMVPLRAVSEATGADVEWEAETKSVYITQNASADSNEGYAKEEKFEGSMNVDEKEYLDTLKECTDYVFDFAIEKEDAVLKALLFEYEYDITGKLTVPDGYYDGIAEKINTLKELEPPSSMSGVQDCVFEYLDVIQGAILGIPAGTYGSEAVERDRAKLREISQEFGVRLYNYFKDNSVNYERIYGEEILDALKRN